MPDRVDPETRRRIMRAVKGKNTGLELRLRSLIWRQGIRGYRCNVRTIPGTPDVAWAGLRVAVFLDSAWWHGHPSRWTPGRSPSGWDEKIARNVARDDEVTTQLKLDGWRVVRIWDFELARDPALSVSRVGAAVDAAKAGRRSAQPRS